MQNIWAEREKKETERERGLEKQRVVYMNSDLYPGGEFVPELEARITVFDRGYTVGDNAYEAARTYKHEPFQVKEHMDRMFTSLKVLRINPGLSKEKFCELCEELTHRNMSLLNEDEEYAIFWEVTRGEWGWHGRRPPVPEGAGRPTIIIKNKINNPWHATEAFFAGIHLVTPPTRHIPPQSWDPKIKTYSRLNYVLAMNEARLVDPKAMAIMQDQSGNLTEATGANVWIVRDGVLMTPAENNLLRGQTRANVIYLAKELNIETVEMDLQPWHLYNCDEAFVSTTMPGPIRPVGRFNGILVGKDLPGPVTKRLAQAWSDWVGIDVTGRNRITKEEIGELEKMRNKLNQERSEMTHITC